MAKSFNARMAERFKQISTSYDKVNRLVHDTAMEIVAHAKEHKDCSTAQGLVMALPASMRREMLILWFSRYTPIVVKNSDDWTAKMHQKDTKLYVDWNLEEAAANPFYELAKQNPEKPALDDEGILKVIAACASRLEKMSDEGKIRPEFVDAAIAAAAQLKKIKIKASEPANNNEEPQKPAANG